MGLGLGLGAAGVEGDRTEPSGKSRAREQSLSKPMPREHFDDGFWRSGNFASLLKCRYLGSAYIK